MKHPTQVRLRNSTAAKTSQQITPNTARAPRLGAGEEGTARRNMGKASGDPRQSAPVPAATSPAEATAHPVITPTEQGAASAVAAPTEAAQKPAQDQDPKGISPLDWDNQVDGLFGPREGRHYVSMMGGIAGTVEFSDSQLLDRLAIEIYRHRQLIIDHILPKIENPFHAAAFAEVLVIAEFITDKCGIDSDLDEKQNTIFDPTPVQLLAATASYWPREGGAK